MGGDAVPFGASPLRRLSEGSLGVQFNLASPYVFRFYLSAFKSSVVAVLDA